MEPREVFNKYGFDLGEVATADSPASVIKVWVEEVREKVLSPLDNYSKAISPTAASVVKAHKNATNDDAVALVESFTELLSGDVLQNNETLAVVINKIDDLKKFLAGVIESNNQRQSNIDAAKASSRKSIHEDYKVLREQIINIASIFASKQIKEWAANQLPMRNGNFGGEKVSGTTPFYNFYFQVDDEVFVQGEEWYVIARTLEVSLVSPKHLLFMDFMDILEEVGNFKFTDSELDSVEFTLNGHNVKIERAS